MYFRNLGEHPGTDDEAAASAAASRRAAAEWYKKYQDDCKGIRILEHLDKPGLGPLDKEILLRRRLKELPKVFEEKAKLDRRASLWPTTRVFADPLLERRRLEEVARTTNALSPQAYKVELAKLQATLGYPPGYALGNLQTELARARCELSRFIWRSIAP